MNAPMHILATLAAAAMASATLGDSINLRGSVRMPADGGPLLLEDVAVMKGIEAQRFATLEVYADGDLHEAIEIHVDEIQELLADAGVNWAKTALSGGAVVVRPRVTSSLAIGLNTLAKPGHEALKGASAPMEVGGGASNETTRFRHITAWADGEELHCRIVELIKAEWGEEASNLHLAIDLAQLAALPTDATQITMESRGSSRGTDWFDIQFRAVRSNSSFRPTKTVLVRVDLRIMHDSAIAQRRLGANRTLKLDDLSTAPRLVKPSDAARALRPEDLTGRRLARRVEAGDPVLSRLLQPEVVVRRNDSVHVVMHGPFQLSGSEAMALERGAVGERINCRWRAGDEPFTALVVGPGEVRAGG